jgi:hypothetical protein
VQASAHTVFHTKDVWVSHEAGHAHSTLNLIGGSKIECSVGGLMISCQCTASENDSA